MWSDKLESEIKNKVSKNAVALKLTPFYPNKINSIQSLVSTIENILD
jgi:hypothetical protein